MSTATQTATYRCPHCQQPVDVELGHENEMLVCPNENCKKPFKVEVPKAKPVGELILPPGTKEEEAAAAPAAAPAPVAQPAGEAKEAALAVVHLQLFRRYPLRVTAYVLVILGCVLAAVVFGAVHEQMFLTLLAAVVGGLTAYRLAAWWLRMRHTTLTVTNKRVILQSGVFTKKSIEQPLDEVADIHVKQNFVQRMFRVGDLELVNKKGDAHRILIMAVPSPKELACLMRDRKYPEPAPTQVQNAG